MSYHCNLVLRKDKTAFIYFTKPVFTCERWETAVISSHFNIGRNGPFSGRPPDTEGEEEDGDEI